MEHYAEKSHGLFPRFIIAASGLALLQFALILAVALVIPLQTQSGLNVQPRFVALEAISDLFPFAFFGLFYAASRVRVNLGSDYAGVALSIFIGSLAVTLVQAFIGAVPGQSYDSSSIFDLTLQTTAAAFFASIELTFIGFAAVLLSFRRHM